MGNETKATIGLVLGAVVVVVLGLLTWILWRFVGEWRESNRSLGALIESTQTSQPVKMDLLGSTCHANALTGATCVITNRTDKVVSTCFKGVVINEVNKTLDSVIGCTGRILPNETKSLSLPWLNGEVEDICFQYIGGQKVVDWSSCTFEVKQM